MFKSLLREWGLEKYIEKFEDEEIDDEAFPILTSDTIKSIFTKGGPYSKFLNKYNNWKQSAAACKPSAVNSGEDISSDGYWRNLGNGAADESLTRESSQELPDQLLLTNYVINSFSEQVPIGTSTPGPPNKKRLICPDFPKITEGFMHEALKDNYYGTISIMEYKMNGSLSQISQKHVTECVILKEVKGDIEKKISAARFKELAALIVQYFPSESESTYYVPYHKDIDGKKFGASGKLVDLLYNIRRRANKVGKSETTLPLQETIHQSTMLPLQDHQGDNEERLY